MNDGIPAHIGIIMDGNGRWAKARGLPRTEGHNEGLKVAKRIVRAARESGIRYLSLYVFSTENWKRASEEVGFLMSLVSRHLFGELSFYKENGVRLAHSGNRDGLPPEVRREIDRAIEATRQNDGIVVNLAINYGGRDEIARAAKALAERGAAIDERAIDGELQASGIPFPDLLVRTGGELRLSNFLLWQSAYSELYFSPKLWPDWSEDDLRAAIASYGERSRRFGGTP